MKDVADVLDQEEGAVIMKTLRIVKSALSAVAFIGLIGVPSASASTIYDLSADWSTSNPAPTWSYGKYDSGLTPASFSLFTTYLTAGDLRAWWNGVDDPNIVKNIGVSTVTLATIAFHPNAVVLAPYLGPTVARWTAPSAGMFQLDALFATVQDVNSAPNAYIYDGTTLNNLGVIPAFGATVGYHQTLTLAAGQYVDFVVWGANQNNKTTEVSATVTAVPEPATLSLLGLGLLGLGATLRARRK